MTPEAAYSSVDLSEYGRVIRRRKWLILAIALLATLAGVAYARLQPRQFATAAQVQLPDERDQSSAPRDVAQDVQTQVQVIRSEVVAARAAEALDSRDPRAISKRLTATSVEDSRVINVRFVDDTAADAQAGANAFATAYIDLQTEAQQAEVEAAVQLQEDLITDLNTRAASADADLQAAQVDQAEDPTNPALIARSTSAQRTVDEIQSQLGDAREVQRNIRATPIEGGRLLTGAPRPGGPINAGPVKTGGLGLLAGLVLGIGLAFVRDRLDAQVRDTGDIEHTLGVPSLGAVPLFSEKYRSRRTNLVTVHAPDSAEADAFRRLRGAIVIAAQERGAKVLLVTSAIAGEGKSTVAANLAVALAQAGRSVVVVSADVRRPSLDEIFEQDGAAGLGDVLEGRVHLDEVVSTLGRARFALITSGKVESNPSDLLQSPRMAKLLETLRARYELVILDTPPVLAVADALGMVPMADGVLMVVALDDTSSDEVADAENQLRRVGAHILGAIVNRSELEAKRYQAYREAGGVPVPTGRRSKR